MLKADKLSKARTATDDLHIYQPSHASSTSEPSLTTDLQWVKLPTPHVSKRDNEALDELAEGKSRTPMKAVSDVGGYSVVLVPGDSPCLILREASTTPRVFDLRGQDAVCFAELKVEQYGNGFISVDKSVSVKPTEARGMPH